MLTQGLPTKYAVKEDSAQPTELELENLGFPHPKDYPPSAPARVVEDINQVLKALEDNFDFRLRYVYPEIPLRDRSLDFRSNLIQTVLAADGVLKCAIALLRKDLLGLNDEKHSQSTSRDNRNCMGVILHLNFQPAMKVHPQHELMTEIALPQNASGETSHQPTKIRTRLAVFEAGFSHLSNIPGFCEFYHEAFHLIFTELKDPGPERLEEPPEMFVDLSPFDDNDEDWATQECFVLTMMLFFYL